MTRNKMYNNSCEFCNINPERILVDGKHIYAIFSFWPVSPYHTLLIPKKHAATDVDLSSDEILELYRIKNQITHIIGRMYGYHAYNFGINIGAEAGQTIPHVHYHLIFRRKGDVSDPTGGIRNIIPKNGSYTTSPENKKEQDVMRWTYDIKQNLHLIS